MTGNTLKVRARRFDADWMQQATAVAFGADLGLKPKASKHAKKEMPLIVKPSKVSHRQLLDLLYTLDFDESSPIPKVLPPELASRVVSFLTVKPVESSSVRAVCCSTHDCVHPLSETLSTNENTWWLAQPGSMPAGKGRQYVQYSLSSTLCRLQRVSIKIPPLPLGPLSVREFYLETFHVERGWFKISPNYFVENQGGWQTYELPNDGLDVDDVRVVCLRNQMAEYLEDLDTSAIRSHGLANDIHRFNSVGFFSIRFE